MNYRWMNRGDRIEAPLVREGGRHGATDWDVALDRLRRAGQRRAARWCSWPRAAPRPSRSGCSSSCVGGTTSPRRSRSRWATEAPLPGIPDLALRRERAPNGDGARLLGYVADWSQAALAAASAPTW